MNILFFFETKTMLLLIWTLFLASMAVEGRDSFTQWVCRNTFSDSTNAAELPVDRQITTSYTVNQYIVSGPPSAYFCSLAHACVSSPFGGSDGTVYEFSKLGEIAAQLGPNECKSVLTRAKEGYAERSVGICGELSNVIIECPRMPLMVFHDEVQVLAIKRDASIGTYWESPPADNVDARKWLECGAEPRLMHSSTDESDKWGGVGFQVYWTDDDPPANSCTETGGYHPSSTICKAGWLRWAWADNDSIDRGLPSTVARCKGTQYPDVINWRNACQSGGCKDLPWTR